MIASEATKTLLLPPSTYLSFSRSLPTFPLLSTRHLIHLSSVLSHTPVVNSLPLLTTIGPIAISSSPLSSPFSNWRFTSTVTLIIIPDTAFTRPLLSLHKCTASFFFHNLSIHPVRLLQWLHYALVSVTPSFPHDSNQVPSTTDSDSRYFVSGMPVTLAVAVGQQTLLTSTLPLNLLPSFRRVVFPLCMGA